MEYREFEVEIRPGKGRSCEVRFSSQYGIQQLEYKLPFSTKETVKILTYLEGSAPGSQSESEISHQKLNERVDEIQRIGHELFRSLIIEEASPAFHRCLGNVEGLENTRIAGLRLRLLFVGFDQLGAPKEVVSYPWELLRDPFSKSTFCMNSATPVVRYFNAPKPIRPLLVKPPIRVLVVTAEPEDLPDLEFEDERRLVIQELERVPGVQVEELKNPGLRTLRKRLLDHKSHILHFIGHGKFESDLGRGLIGFCDNRNQCKPVTGQSIAEQLQECTPNVRLIFLNACSGAGLPRHRGQDAYSGVASALVGAGFPAVVAMQFPISNQAAITFASGFYESLAAGTPVDAAMAEGRLKLKDENPDTLEWITPVLFLSSKNAQIFKFTDSSPATGQPEETTMPEDTASATTDALRLSVRSIDGFGVEQDELANEFLDLREFFEDRYIRNTELWKSKVFPRLHDFLFKHARGDRPFHLSFAAHSTVAFAAGYCLEAKSGMDITIVQRTPKGTFDWREGNSSLSDEPFWKDEDSRILDGDASDVAVAISLNREVMQDVEFFLQKSNLRVSRILPATLDPEPSATGVRDWDHSFQLAQQVESKIRSRVIRERLGTVHIFAAAPNVFMFHLGQLSRAFGALQLYEYDFPKMTPGGYSPSLRLPLEPTD